MRGRYIVTNMVKPERLEVVHRRLEGLSMELLCDVPYDPKLEELIFSGESLAKLDGGPISACIETIIERIGGSNAGT